MKLDLDKLESRINLPKHQNSAVQVACIVITPSELKALIAAARAREEMREAMVGMIAEADRETEPFIKARALVEAQ